MTIFKWENDHKLVLSQVGRGNGQEDELMISQNGQAIPKFMVTYFFPRNQGGVHDSYLYTPFRI